MFNLDAIDVKGREFEVSVYECDHGERECEERDAVPDGIVRVDVGDREERRLPERICAHSRRFLSGGYVYTIRYGLIGVEDIIEPTPLSSHPPATWIDMSTTTVVLNMVIIISTRATRNLNGHRVVSALTTYYVSLHHQLG